MRVSHPYLRVVAGFFAAVFLMGVVDLGLDGEAGAAIVALVLAGALGWYAVIGPLRVRARRISEQNAATAARADAANQAYLAGDLRAAMAPPPPVPPRLPVRRGVLAAVGVAALLFVIAVVSVVTGSGEAAGAVVPHGAALQSASTPAV
ncbi:hypothetical protein [Tomitella fengzijianii]|uniref:Uncharacterized protein n=1 Tax=Tomitella fengzijianii TaxID=2597660 RepID=A0A516X1N2_9ACTN|nr:hypothetical protein [Tomitella fengzijianii]QDQ96996.1 hypothetical protein FO059_06160 [Tomitella fengzijianii]